MMFMQVLGTIVWLINFQASAEGTLIMWFDASNAASITKDGSDKVSEWRDQSGKSYHLKQPTSSSQPTHFANDGYIEFDNMGATEYWMKTSQVAAGVMVNPLHVIWDIEMSAIGSNAYIFDGFQGDTMVFLQFSSTRSLLYCGAHFNNDNTHSIGVRATLEAVFHGGSSKFAVNGGPWATGSAGSSPDPRGLTVGIDGFGRDHNTAKFKLYGLKIYGGDPSDAERTARSPMKVSPTCTNKDGLGGGAVEDVDCGAGNFAIKNATACSKAPCEIAGGKSDFNKCCKAATCGDPTGKDIGAVNDTECGHGFVYDVSKVATECSMAPCEINTGNKTDRLKCCKAYACTIGSGTGCASCVLEAERLSDAHCATCNIGYKIDGSACKATNDTNANGSSTDATTGTTGTTDTTGNTGNSTKQFSAMVNAVAATGPAIPFIMLVMAM